LFEVPGKVVITILKFIVPIPSLMKGLVAKIHVPRAAVGFLGGKGGYKAKAEEKAKAKAKAKAKGEAKAKEEAEHCHSRCMIKVEVRYTLSYKLQRNSNMSIETGEYYLCHPSIYLSP